MYAPLSSSSSRGSSVALDLRVPGASVQGYGDRGQPDRLCPSTPVVSDERQDQLPAPHLTVRNGRYERGEAKRGIESEARAFRPQCESKQRFRRLRGVGAARVDQEGCVEAPGASVCEGPVPFGVLLDRTRGLRIDLLQGREGTSAYIGEGVQQGANHEQCRGGRYVLAGCAEGPADPRALNG